MAFGIIVKALGTISISCACRIAWKKTMHLKVLKIGWYLCAFKSFASINFYLKKCDPWVLGMFQVMTNNIPV